jgi:3alpha(or 20beta)-hydroxysteroid dehydrogenase
MGNRGLLDGQVALVTGAAQGMGESFARLLADAGARVVVTDVNAALGQSVADSIGPDAMFVKHDVSSETDWAALIAAVEKKFGAISILVNNAGIAVWGSLEKSPLSDARRMIEVDQIGVFLGMRAVIPSMRKAGKGSIINIASVASLKGTIGLTLYSACKWAVRGMTKCAAMELGADNIRVNAIAPGAIMTERQLRLWHTPQTAAALVARQALHAQVTEADVADAVLFLAADDSRMITKQCITVDAGLR